jgi:hypothetical protein
MIDLESNSLNDNNHQSYPSKPNQHKLSSNHPSRAHTGKPKVKFNPSTVLFWSHTALTAGFAIFVLIFALLASLLPGVIVHTTQNHSLGFISIFIGLGLLAYSILSMVTKLYLDEPSTDSTSVQNINHENTSINDNTQNKNQAERSTSTSTMKILFYATLSTTMLLIALDLLSIALTLSSKGPFYTWLSSLSKVNPENDQTALSLPYFADTSRFLLQNSWALPLILSILVGISILHFISLCRVSTIGFNVSKGVAPEVDLKANNTSLKGEENVKNGKNGGENGKNETSVTINENKIQKGDGNICKSDYINDKNSDNRIDIDELASRRSVNGNSMMYQDPNESQNILMNNTKNNNNKKVEKNHQHVQNNHSAHPMSPSDTIDPSYQFTLRRHSVGVPSSSQQHLNNHSLKRRSCDPSEDSQNRFEITSSRQLPQFINDKGGEFGNGLNSNFLQKNPHNDHNHSIIPTRSENTDLNSPPSSPTVAVYSAVGGGKTILPTPIEFSSKTAYKYYPASPATLNASAHALLIDVQSSPDSLKMTFDFAKKQTSPTDDSVNPSPVDSNDTTHSNNVMYQYQSKGRLESLPEQPTIATVEQPNQINNSQSSLTTPNTHYNPVQTPFQIHRPNSSRQDDSSDEDQTVIRISPSAFIDISDSSDIEVEINQRERSNIPTGLSNPDKL